ncbi:hypothetical protein Clacol_010151 [Clathrus columnatus]|uniref:DUF6533 domain-containing protein n=1 Tax=Clathrus columnatus TaxID=1419009 RepID=A0AAV5AQT7_9AGAM|nr:hypothetical protein Clacol_010151 [Clathrus columnatus]
MATALIFYDTILTFPDAVKYIYTRKFTLISWLYVSAQYGTLCGVVLNWAVFTNTLTDWVPRATTSLQRAIGQISITLFDIGVASTLLYHTWGPLHRQRSEDGYSTSFALLFIRQGIFRFVIISAWSLGDALSYKLARPSATGSDTSLEIVLSAILLGRFLFQLRRAAEKRDNLENSDESIESHQMTSFRAAENLNYQESTTTTVFTDHLPLAFASGDSDSDTLPGRTRSLGKVSGKEKLVV